MDIIKVQYILGAIFFLASVQLASSVTVKCEGATLFQPACCRVRINSDSADITKIAAEDSAFNCVKGENYYYLFYSRQQAYICVLFGCGGTFTVTASTSWSNWGNWASCSVACGAGTQTRTRTCATGRASDCSSNANDATESRACIIENCTPVTRPPTTWNAWGNWGACSVNCGAGTQTRIRTCNTGINTDCSTTPNANKLSKLCIRPACTPGNVGTTAAPTPTSSCGMAPAALGYRVIGGTQARTCQFPWMVMIYNTRRSTACGGSIIDATHILTAAHCVVSPTSFGSVAANGPNDLKIFTGASTMPFRQYVQTIPGIHQRRASRIKVHENYNDESVENDIAIITLDAPIAFDNCHVPICLPSSQQAALGSTGCKVMGWGTTSNSRNAQVSSDLLYTGVQVLQPYSCTSLYGNTNFNANLKLCAGGDGTGSCSGDSGGPLACPTANGRYYQYGIVSSGAARRCGDLPSMYTKVTSFLSWIQTNTQ